MTKTDKTYERIAAETRRNNAERVMEQQMALEKAESEKACIFFTAKNKLGWDYNRIMNAWNKRKAELKLKK